MALRREEHEQSLVEPHIASLAVDPGEQGRAPLVIMRDYERGPDGTWHDGLLMDLLATDLTEAGPFEADPTGVIG
ncbi:hypothetical protein [Streptomyces sp. NPDC058665]|uniref:hypothetical protein n=1 Tax=Streptomyces sp. NPDC058665 TaxID=3346586 RepID=UPI003649BD9E